MYSVLLSPLWLKSVPGWPAISVSTSQQSRVGQIVWFGCLSAISQLASRVGEGGGVRHFFLHSLTLPGPGGESGEGGCVPSPWESFVDEPEDSSVDLPEDSSVDLPEDSSVDLPEDSSVGSHLCGSIGDLSLDSATG